jgi:hypothetical protein
MRYILLLAKTKPRWPEKRIQQYFYTRQCLTPHMRGTPAIIISFILAFLVAALLYFAMPERNPAPSWVKEIKSKVDLGRCGPENCESCDTAHCANLTRSCIIMKERYSCGHSCDAGISYCVPKNSSG